MRKPSKLKPELALRSYFIVGVIPLFSLLAGLPESMAETPRAAEPGVTPGINETWKSDDTDRLTGILEGEDREVFIERASVAALVGPLPGATVADIGAGSGFMVEEFARLVGDKGKVYAVDINPHMMKLVGDRMHEQGLGDRVETVVCDEKSVGLAESSIDLAFVCDTYHHFEYPESSLESIYRALKSGGQLIVVEFHRKEGESDPWVLEHVRAGQEAFTREIEAAGFELINVHNPPFLERNYILRFRKKP